MQTNLAKSVLALAAGLTTVSGNKANADSVYGVSDQLNLLVSFNSATPGTLLTANYISGLQNGEQIRGIDWISGTLYGLGDQSHLYTINPLTGAATLVGTGAFSPILNGIDFGFNAGTSQLYVSSDLGQNLTLNPMTAVATAGANYTGASIDAMAYDYFTGSFYGISAANHDLYSMNPVTGGTSLIGATGVGFSDRIGFDISPATDRPISREQLVGRPSSSASTCPRARLSLIGDVGTPGELTSGLDSIAIVPEPATAALMPSASGSCSFCFAAKNKRKVRIYGFLNGRSPLAVALWFRVPAPHTSKFAPWHIRSATAFQNEQRALAFERYLKTGSALLQRERRWVRSVFGGEFNAALVAPINSPE